MSCRDTVFNSVLFSILVTEEDPIPAGPGVSMNWDNYTRHYNHEVRFLKIKS